MARVTDYAMITPKRTEMMNSVVRNWCMMYSLPFRYWRHGCIDEESCSYITRRPAKVRQGPDEADYGDAEDRQDCMAFIVGQLRGMQFTTPEIRKVLDLSAGACCTAMNRYREIPEDTKRMMLQASGLEARAAVRAFLQGGKNEQ